MPGEGRKPLTVDEVTWTAVKFLVKSESTEYDTYDDFVRDAVKNADNHYDELPDELREDVEDAGQRVPRSEVDFPEP